MFEIKELKNKNPNQIKRSLAGKHVVSTICRDSVIVMLDNALSSLTDLFGGAEAVGVNDLSTPGVYETMVFPCDEEGNPTSWSEVDFRRYDSEEEAIDGHLLLVDKYSAG